ncbi:2-hydroxycarboxylate transporter family protein [Spirillospora sp. CA-255316]
MLTSDPDQTRDRTAAGPETPTEHPRRSAIAGFPPVVFALGFALMVTAAFTDHLPPPMITGFAVAMTLGGLLAWLGGRVPVLRDYGLPTVLCIFGPPLLVFAGAMPKPVVETITTFTDDMGFLDFFVVAIITGSVLGMPRRLLLKAGPRFIVPLLGCVLLTLFIIGALGWVTGHGFREALFYIAAPTMAGGLGIGALPMSEMYAHGFGGSPNAYMPTLMAAVVLANSICILIASIYNGLGNRRQLFVGFNGHGQLLRMEGTAADLSLPKQHTSADFTALAQGLLMSCVLLVAGVLLAALVPDVHELAWAVLIAAVVKIFGLLPRRLEDAAAAWNGLATTAWLPTLLVCVSISYIDIGEVLDALRDPLFLLLTAASVVLSALIAGTLGWLVRMNFVEASITPGLTMADSGGSGDVAVLSAADRLHLMPFAQLSNRLGGVFVLLFVSLLVPLF